MYKIYLVYVLIKVVMCLRPGVALFHKDPNKPATEMNAIWLCEDCGEVHRNSTRRLLPGKKKEDFDRSMRVKLAHGYCQCSGCEMCIRDSTSFNY